MATPVFQHGKNSFLALGYDPASTLATAAASGSTSLTVTNITAALTGESVLVTGGRYGLFVGGVPVMSASAPASTTTLTASATVSGTCLPMYNISPYINDINFPQAIETPETTTFSAAGVKTYIVGLKGYTISFSGHYEASSGGMDDIMNGLIAFQDAGNFIPFVYGPASPGQFAGSSKTADIKYYGAGVLSQYDIKSSVSGVIEFSSQLQVSGAVVRTTI